ncbi:MAG TPA: hypothetical protein VF163_11175 [Micromonosporaceae bacterium]
MQAIGEPGLWPPGPVTPEQPPQPHDPVAARIRNLVIDRILRMNARHATHAWLQRRSQPVGPHGLAFFYCDPVSPPPAASGGSTLDAGSPATAGGYAVAAATRLVNDGEDVRDLARLLYRFATLARERYLPDAGGFDPVAHMTNRHDPMSASASYIGLGISSLDTEAADWEEAQRTASGPLDIAGRCFVVLRDGSTMVIERGGQDVFGEVRIASTHDLNIEIGISTRRWIWQPQVASVKGTPELWRQLYELHRLALLPRTRSKRRH